MSSMERTTPQATDKKIHVFTFTLTTPGADAESSVYWSPKRFRFPTLCTVPANSKGAHAYRDSSLERVSRMKLLNYGLTLSYIFLQH